MPYTIEKVSKSLKFKNVHGNYEQPFSAIIRLFDDQQLNGFNAYVNTSQDVKDIIKYCLANKMPVRACGSLWSLTKVHFVKGGHIFTYDEDDEESCEFKYLLESKDKKSIVKNDNLLFAQCGNTIKKISEFLEPQSLSLKTSGASNGQTIAGAIGTGVHGSSHHVGSIQDTVLGLHIIKGPKADDSVFIQAKSKQAVTQAFANKINATLINDDELFSAALVGLGSYGYVQGVLVETEPIFSLENFIRNSSLDEIFQFAKTLSTNGTNLKVPGRTDANLFHVKFYINQYDGTTRAEVIHKVPGLPRGRPKFLKYNKDFLLGAVKLLTLLAPGAIEKQINKRLPKQGEKETHTLAKTFYDTTNLRDGQFSCALAVSPDHVKDVYDLMVKPWIKNGRKKIPALFSMRFVPQSKAMMAFTKYPMNCVLEIDGIVTKPIKKYLKDITKILIDSGIPHTWHWGKANEMDTAFVKKMYGTARTKFVKKRISFLGAKVAQIFSNEYCRNRGVN